jgi:hypothetical protein
VLREVEDVARAGRAEAVDRLEVVADRGHVAALAPQAADDVDLQPVDVLVLVDQHVVEGIADLRADDLVARQAAPVQQQVVEIEHPECPLARAVRAEQHGEVVGVL